MSVLISHTEAPSTLLLCSFLTDDEENENSPLIHCQILSGPFFYSTLLGELSSSSHFTSIFCRLLTYLFIEHNKSLVKRIARNRLKYIFSSIHIPNRCQHFVQLQSSNNYYQYEQINRRWASIQLHILILLIRYEKSWAWLSTLGGGHSCLGEQSSQHALEAEAISKNQICLSRDIGDPNAIIKSYLFVALSYLQQKRYDETRTILRFQYRCIQKPDVTDDRLRVMCIALWKKMKYAMKHNK